MRSLLNESANRAITYLENNDLRKVGPDPSDVQALHKLDEALQKEGTDPHEVIRVLDEVCSPATTLSTGGRFFGYVIGGTLPVTLAANWLAGAWDQNSGLYAVTPATAHLEQVALGWLIDLFGLPLESGGAFVTGATVANLCGLATGRQVVLKRAGWDVEADGLFGAPSITVIIGEEAHPVLFKSLGLLGLGRERVVFVPTDEQGRMRSEKLPTISGPTIVCLQAGNVNTGAFDPFEPIIDRVHDAGGWVHVDGAFGLWAAATPSLAHLTAGVERADSLATDAHKYLNVPYDSGIAIVNQPDALRAAMAVYAAYLPTESADRNPSDYTPELSRRARGVEVWAALKYLGREGVAELVEGTCRHARSFAEGLSNAGYQILNNVVLNQVLVSFGDSHTTRQIINEIQEDGTCWLDGTEWQGHTAVRISVCSWATTDEDVEMSLEAILRAASKHSKK
jgi:glutamate/tyrosine decarboxylase-like PLP-dependent enzyme